MNNATAEMIVIPEGAPYGVHITYHYAVDNDFECVSPTRKRAVYTEEQLNLLEAEYKKKKFINTARRQELAYSLGIEMKQVKDWFQNRRTKERSNGIVIERIKKQKRTKTEERIANIIAFLKDEEPIKNKSEETLQFNTCDIEATVEVLQKHAENTTFDQRTSTPRKRGLWEIDINGQIVPASSSCKRRRCDVEILDHQIYDPITGMWQRY